MYDCVKTFRKVKESFDAHNLCAVLCYQISSSRYTTKEKEAILEKKKIPMSFKTKMECQKVKCKADCNKIGQSQLNMQAVLRVFSKPSKILLAAYSTLPKILPVRGSRRNKNE